MPTTTDETSSGLQAIRRSTIHAFRRFPGVLIVAALATGLSIQGLLSRGFNGEFPYWAALLTCLLGISWLYSLSLIAERRLSGPAKWALPLLVGALSLGLYYFRIRAVEFSGNPIAFVLEYAGFVVALHFFAAYAPFLGFRQPRAFWEYNRAVFQRFLLALLFSATLILGISLFLALLSRILQNLPFDLLYFILIFLIIGVFNTWFFLAGVPEDFEGLELQPKPYPRALKFFAQFVLLPLTVAIGSVLAISMLQRLLGGHSLDAASIGSLLALGGFGLLTYLLLYPLEEDSGQRWLKIFRRGFFLVLLPFLAAVVFSSLRLVQNYGWTPSRYYGLLLTLWGLALSFYLVIVRRPRIPWIPVSLSLVALFTVAGPWSAISLTRASQNRRMSKLLDPVLPADSLRLRAMGAPKREELERQASYLEQNYGCEELQPYFGDLLKRRHKEEVDCSTIELYRLLRRDPALPKEELEAEVVNINFLEQSSPGALKVKGYDLYFPSSAIQFLEPAQAVADCPQGPTAVPLCVRRAAESYQVEIFRLGQSMGRIDVEPMVQALLKKQGAAKTEPDSDPYYHTFNLPHSDLSFETRLGGRPARIDFEHLRLEQRGERVSPEYLRFSLLFQEGS